MYIFCSLKFSRVLQAIWYIISNKYLVILTWFFSNINAKMIDVQTRPIFLEGPGETFNWIFCGLYLYVSISQLLKNSLWLGLKLLRGRSLMTLSKFWPFLTLPYPALVREFIYCYKGKYVYHWHPVPPTTYLLVNVVKERPLKERET